MGSSGDRKVEGEAHEPAQEDLETPVDASDHPVESVLDPTEAASEPDSTLV